MTPSMIRWISLCFVACALATGCGGGAENGTARRDAQLELGSEVYVARCAVCHGDKGQGGIGPALGNGVAVASIPEVAENRRVVAQGRNTMPAWGNILSAEEIDAVVLYSREKLGN